MRCTQHPSRQIYRQRESLARRAMSTSRLRLDGRRIWRCMSVLVFLFILADGLFVDPDILVVKTQWGLLRGKLSETMRNRTVANFLGIPYALPPVGDLRFRSPQRWNRTWTTIRDATVDGQQCIQHTDTEIIGNEDCLFLNIFVPYISDVWQNFAKLPVLVFVHGGAFMHGSSNSKLYAPDYLLDQNIILVTLNYRVSALGFFSTTNQISPGNYGIKDIKMALKWIQENIHNFEGNPKSVTVMGHSAGAAATHILALSKKTKGLFHRYILLSGSALNKWSFHPPKRYRQVCLKLAEFAGCLPGKNNTVTASNETTAENLVTKDTSYSGYTVKDDQEIMKCMRMIDARILEAKTRHFAVWRGQPWCNFGPTLENDTEDAILTMHPLKIMKNALFRDIPAIMQVVKDEGLMKTHESRLNPESVTELIENFEEYLPYLTEYNEVISNTSAFAFAIEDFYYNGNVTLSFTKRNVTEMASDALIIWPVFQSVQYQSKLGKSSIYFSFFAYQGTFTNFLFSSPISTGITHGDDLNYLFPKFNNKYSYLQLHNTEEDVNMISIMTEMWANFVIKGIPKAWQIPEWPSYRDHHEFMRFGIDRLSQIVVQTDFLSDRMEFWEKLMMNESMESTELQYSTFINEDIPYANNVNTYFTRSAILISNIASVILTVSILL